MGIYNVFRKPIEAGLIPGVVALAANDRGVFYEGAFGRRTVDKPEPMTLDFVFRIASMTKAVTGTAAMRAARGLYPLARGCRRIWCGEVWLRRRDAARPARADTDALLRSHWLRRARSIVLVSRATDGSCPISAVELVQIAGDSSIWIRRRARSYKNGFLDE